MSEHNHARGPGSVWMRSCEPCQAWAIEQYGEQMGDSPFYRAVETTPFRECSKGGCKKACVLVRKYSGDTRGWCQEHYPTYQQGGPSPHVITEVEVPR